VILGDILKDQQAYPELSGEWRVVLATRSLPGSEISDGEVHVLDVGELKVDEDANEIDIMPTSFMPPGTPAITLSDCLALLSRSTALAEFSLSGVTGVKTLADGGRAQRSSGIIGSYVLAADEEYWLLLSPESQWPAHWFGA
jgi:hypothetical protein